MFMLGRGYLILSHHSLLGVTRKSLYFLSCLHSTKYWNVKPITKYVLRYWFYFHWQVATVMMNALPLNLASTAGARVHANVEWMLYVKCCTTKLYVNVSQGTVEVHLQDARVNCYGSINLLADSVVGWLFDLPYFLNCTLLLYTNYRKSFSCSSYHYGLQSFSLGLCYWYTLYETVIFTEGKLYVGSICSYKSMPSMYYVC